MPKTQKKEVKGCSFRMDAEVYALLEDYCEKSGQSKTVAIERAIKLIAATYEQSHKNDEYGII